MSKSARMAAFNVLYKTEYEKAYLNIALKEELSTSSLDERDMRLASALVYGCVRYKLRLDYVIGLFSAVKLKKLSPKVRMILHLGIYQLLFMEKIPASAAVNECVKICEKLAYKSKGFVNGVLRSIIREKETINYPADWSVVYSYPEELIGYFKGEFKNTEEILCELNREREITVRVNGSVTTTEKLKADLDAVGIRAKNTPLSNALAIGGADITNLDLYKSGAFAVQGLSSILAVDVLDAKEGETVLDMCAAPGGKTCYIAEKVGDTGKVFAFDIHEHKCDLILKNAKRMGFSNVSAKAWDSSAKDDLLVLSADRVLCDVPCMGLGIISKKPDIKYSFTKEGLEELTQLQLKILKTCSAYVKKGGYLVYSTCSMGKKENTDNINKFLADGGFETVSIERYIPDELSCETLKEGYINVMPKGSFDGFFICKMKRV